MPDSSGLREEFRCKAIGFDYDSPQHFVSSECGSGILYPIWTLFWMIYHVTWLVIKPFCEDDFEYKMYAGHLTNWGYTILTAANLMDVVSTFYVHCCRKDIRDNTSEPSTMTWYLKCLWLLFETSNVLAVCITVGNYTVAVIYALQGHTGKPLDEITDISDLEYHAFNTVYVLLNLCISAKPVRILHVIYPLLVAVIYVIFTAIYQLVGHIRPVYPLLDWTIPWRTWIPAFGLGLVVLFVVQLALFGIYKLRVYIHQKCCFRRENYMEIQ